MATLGPQAVTLVDWAKTLDGNNRVGRVAELLSQDNEILQDMIWMEGNLPTGHRIIQRTGLPAVYWRRLNRGTPPSKATTVQVDEATGILEARCHVDVDLAELNGDTAAFRFTQAKAFLEGMNQEMAQTLFYGDVANSPEEINGLVMRYSDLSAANAKNIILGGGQGDDNTSMWLIGWSDNTCYGVYPKGSQAGLTHQDLGVEDVNDGEGNPYRAYRDLWKWKTGLALEDWRYVVRIANIDVSNLVGETSAADLIKLMIRAKNHLPKLAGVRPAWYCNRTVHTMLMIQALNKSNNALSIEQSVNQVTVRFLGIPIRRVDAIMDTETLVD